MKLLRIFACCSVFGLFLDLVLSGCASHPAGSDEVEVMRVPDLTQTETVVESGLFDRFEPIVLETNDSSLITVIEKAEIRNDTIFILDRKKPRLLLFDLEGKFLRNVGKIGDGPEEYTLCYNFALNPIKNQVAMVIPFGFLYLYNLQGEFIKKMRLPSKSNYHDAKWMNQDTLVLWSSVREDTPAITFLDVPSETSVHDTWHRQKELNGIRSPFFIVGEEILLGTPFLNEIYRVEMDSITPIAVWDFGKYNVDMSYFDELGKMEHSRERYEKYRSDDRAGKIAHEKLEFFGNSRYIVAYIAVTTFHKHTFYKVFYDRKDKQSHSIVYLTDGVRLMPVFMNEEFMLAYIRDYELDACQEAFGWDLDVADDDNPVLVKMYFKK
ncbi:MAG: 6-bladed beta-propeller [Bacteroides sp.]|nr:6-bladed beta-propeller [Bacteroides sp.]MCM1390004.1 6-bladed beta-propeller [Bacteroides sp.]